MITDFMAGTRKANNVLDYNQGIRDYPMILSAFGILQRFSAQWQKAIIDTVMTERRRLGIGGQVGVCGRVQVGYQNFRAQR